MRYETETFTFDQYISRLQKRMQEKGGERNCKYLDSRSLNSALYGWPEGRERMQKALATLDPPGKDTECQVYAVAGNEPDVSRYLSGEPENMLAFEDQPDRKTVRIVADVALSGGCIDAVVFMRGAAVVTLIQELEMRGHRVELTVCSTFQQSNKTYVAYVLAKQPGQPADLDRLAFLIGNYATERSLMFETYEMFYGRFIGCCPGMIPDEDRGDLYLEGGHIGHEHWRTPEAAREWINENLCRFTFEPENA